MPIAVVLLVGGHVLLVRRNGVVPPFELDRKLGTTPVAAPGASNSREVSTGARS